MGLNALKIGQTNQHLISEVKKIQILKYSFIQTFVTTDWSSMTNKIKKQ